MHWNFVNWKYSTKTPKNKTKKHLAKIIAQTGGLIYIYLRNAIESINQ